MGTITLATLQTDLLNRVDDAVALGLSSAIPPTNADGLTQATSILNVAQQVINALEQQVLHVVNYTLTPNKIIYGPISTDPTLSTQILKPTAVRFNKRDLVYTPFRSLVQVNPHWMTTVGNRLRTWSLMGRDMLIVYPGLDNVVTTVQVVGIGITVNMVNSTDTMELSDDVVGEVLDFAEVLANIRLQRPEKVAVPLGRLQARYKDDLDTNVWRSRLTKLT